MLPSKLYLELKNYDLITAKKVREVKKFYFFSAFLLMYPRVTIKHCHPGLSVWNLSSIWILKEIYTDGNALQRTC